MTKVRAVLDFEDFTRLGGRKLSLGSHGYAQVWDDKLVTLVHRWVVGAKPRDGRIVDHLNGDRLNDRKLNLPFVTAAKSSANVKVHAASGYRGMYPNKSRWPPLTTASTEPGLQAGSPRPAVIARLRSAGGR